MSSKIQTVRILCVSCPKEDIYLAVQVFRKEGIVMDWHLAENKDQFKDGLNAFRPDAVMAGCSPRVADNLKLLKTARSNPNHLPFILLTSAEHEGVATGCIKAGADDYILKEQIRRLPFAVMGAIEKHIIKADIQKAKEELEEKEKAFHYIIENSENGVFLMKNHKFERINSGFEHIFGYSLKDMRQLNFSLVNMAAPESRKIIDALFTMQAKKDHYSQRLKFTAVTKYGKIKEVEAWVTCKKINENAIAHGIIRDVTHDNQVEANLRESEQKFKLLFQNHSAIKLVIDPDTGNILEANNSAAQFYGWRVEELRQMNVSKINLLHAHEVLQWMEQLKSKPGKICELQHINANGEVADVEIFSSKVDYNGKEVLHFIIHDVTSRKTAEKKLHLLNHAVEQNPVAIVITDPDGKIEYVNPEFTAMTGYTLEEVLGEYPRILKSGQQTEVFYQKLWNTISSGTSWEGEFRNKKKNGEIYWQESSISPILDEHGAITHYVAVMEDVTEKKKMIEDLVRAKEKAEESDRLKSAFLANMSHEIRTPMNGIIGFTDLLKEHKLKGKDKIKYINIIKKSGERMLNTINDLIEISQIESGTMDTDMININLNDLMDSLYYHFMPEAANKGLEFSCHKHLPDYDAMIESDGNKLNAIFLNLIKNAIKYTSVGRIDFGYHLNDSMIEFFIKDTGIGIETDRQRIVFDRFVQADMSMTKPYEGAGLGLSIAKAYVEMLGGEIWLESMPDVGSDFYFTIPYLGKSLFGSDKIPITNQLSDEELLKNLTVMVAEDDAVGQLYLTELLNGSCKKLIVASDGMEALQLFQETPDKIDVILMDIKMPGMNGYETTQKIKEINRKVFVIAQTAYALSGDREKAYASGCDYYLAKPFSKNQLIEAVKNYYG
jgi:PAS domain S-box-containing protein